MNRTNKPKKKSKIKGGDALKQRKSLAAELQSQDLAKSSSTRGTKRKADEEASQNYVDSKLSRKILDVAQQQLRFSDSVKQISHPKQPFSLSAADADKSDDSDDDNSVSSEDDLSVGDLKEHLYTEELGGLGSVEPERLRALIADKNQELESEFGTEFSTASVLPDSVREHFLTCRGVLAKYRTGKLPKPVKQLPHFAQWQELIELMQPNNWTAAAVCAVTKYFTAKGKAPALHYFQQYLLPRVRDDIAEFRRLNFHLYSALKKALFRQREFCCGILVPWARDAISLPEATILGGLLRRVSIPVKYGSTALYLLLQMPYSGGRAILIRSFIEKKYNLPDKVVSACLQHFLVMRNSYEYALTESERLPVLWHQALLSFVRLYSSALSSEERGDLFQLCRQHTHPDITTEVRACLQQTL